MTGAVPIKAATVKLAWALGWNTGGVAVQAVLQLAFAVVLARLLGPATYGLMAMAWIALGPATIIADAGLGLALVQRQSVTSAAIRYCFCVQTLIALSAATVLGAIAPFLSRLFAAPELDEVLLPLSSLVLVQAFGLTAVNLLQRSLDFRRLQIVQLAALIGSTLLVSLPLALWGAGVWSLVVGAMTNVAIISICASALARRTLEIEPRLISMLAGMAATVPVLFAIDGASVRSFVAAICVNSLLVAIGLRQASKGRSLRELRRLGGFGTAPLRFLLLNIVNAIIGALPAIVIGRLFGVSALGLYDRAHALIVTPLARAAAAVSSVLFSHHAKLHRDGGGEAEVFYNSLILALFLGLPIATVVALNDSLIIQSAFGSEWLAAVPLLKPFAVCLVLILTLQVAVPVLNGRGRPEIEIGIQLLSVALFLLLVALNAHGDLVDILWALVAAYAFRVICLLCGVAILIAARPARILLAALPGVGAALLVLAADQTLALFRISGLDRLAAMAALSALGIVLAWFAYRARSTGRLRLLS